MINKNDRVYINDWFNSDQKLKEGDVIDFEMPPFCSGEYSAKIFIDNDGDPFIKKSDDYSEGCRDYELIKKEDYENC